VTQHWRASRQWHPTSHLGFDEALVAEEKVCGVSVSYFVRYEGQAEDLAAFVTYYRERHVPILAAMPGIERIVLHTPVAWSDPFPVKPDRFMLMAQMEFGSREDQDRALESAARGAAREDFRNFPPFQGAVFHQAALSEEVFAK
jgi:uncharacterized protein (TIGR02118 family)